MPAPEFSFVTTSYAVREVRVSVVRDAIAHSDKAATPKDIVALFKDTISKSEWYDAEKECFVVVLLNRRNQVKGFNLVSLGTQTASLAHPREVFRAAIVGNACAIVCIHNHPSGDPAPSRADLAVTRQLREAAKIVDVDLLDHVIVGDVVSDPLGKGYYSFREMGQC